MFAGLLASAAPSNGQTDAEIAARITPALAACQSDPKNGGTLQQAMCEADEAHRQDEQLNKTWKRVIAVLPPPRQRALRENERAWIRQSDESCRAERDGYVHSTASYMFSHCLVEETIRRTMWLERHFAMEPVNVTPPARPLDGTWKFDYSCAGATGMYADRCSAGERDYFMLSIVQSGHRLCGFYEATAQIGNHVDDGDLKDWKFTPTAGSAFRVHFHLTGTVGEAVVRVNGDKMHWKVLTERATVEDTPPSGPFFPPHTATLVRQEGDKAPACTP